MQTLSACYDIHCVVLPLSQIPVPTSLSTQTSRKNGSGVWVPRLGMPTERHSPFSPSWALMGLSWSRGGSIIIHDDVTRAPQVSECNKRRLSRHLCPMDCHLLVLLFAGFARTALCECINGFVTHLCM